MLNLLYSDVFHLTILLDLAVSLKTVPSLSLYEYQGAFYSISLPKWRLKLLVSPQFLSACFTRWHAWEIRLHAATVNAAASPMEPDDENLLRGKV